MTKDDQRRYLILKDPNIYKGLLILALPIMLNNFIKTIHDVVDIVFVSRVVENSASAVGAISATFPVMFTFISLGIGLSIAGTALISQLIGNRQTEEASRYAGNLVYLSFIIGVVLLIIGFFGAPYVMSLMGAKDYLLEKSTMYLRIRAFELPFLFIFFAYQAIRQASGDTVSPVIYGIITVILNIILSPILILILDLGVEGAAYATLIAQVSVAPFVIYNLFSKDTMVTISFSKLKPIKRVIDPIVKTAVPAALGQAITAIGFIVLTSTLLYRFSYTYTDALTGLQMVNDDVVGAFSVGNRMSSLALHPVMAIGGVLSAYIGQNIGNLNPERAKDSFKKAMVLSVGIMTILSLILMPFRAALTGVFYDVGTDVFDLTVKYMFYLLIGLPLMAIFQAFIGAFNGTGKTTYTFVVSVTRLWGIRIPLILLFVYVIDIGPSGVWTAMLISNFLIAFIGYFFYKTLTFEPKVQLDIY